MKSDQNFKIPTELENIPIVFKNQYPDWYPNSFWGWFFGKGTITQNRGKLLTLDIDFGRKCSLDCPHCFRKDNQADKINGRDLTFDEILKIIQECFLLMKT